MMIFTACLILVTTILWRRVVSASRSAVISQQNGTKSARAMLESSLKIPFVANALEFTIANEVDNGRFGNCNDFEEGGGLADAQKNNDPICATTGPCHIGWTEPGEWVAYEFSTDKNDIIELPDGLETIVVDITVRVASHSERNMFELEIVDNNEFGPIAFFNSPGEGYQEFKDIVWRSVNLYPEDQHELHVRFSDGRINLCSVKIKKSNIPPITISALEYINFQDSDEDHQGNCGAGPVDAQLTTDDVCRNRDRSECNIAWTKPGEWLSYDFTIDYDRNYFYEIWVRFASFRTGRKILLELSPPVRGRTLTMELNAPGKGYQKFEDSKWQLPHLGEGDYTVRVNFITGGVNLCSVSIKDSAHHSFVSVVPSTTNALNYMDYAELTHQQFGNCEYDGPVDAQLTDDPTGICQESGACNIAYTDAGEYVKYHFETDGRNATINASFRAASQRADKSFQVELLADTVFEKTFQAPGLGWQIYQDLIWENINIGTGRYHEMFVHFTTGQVNLCSFSIAYV